MKLKYILILAFVFFYNNCFSCDCKTPEKETMVERGLQYSDIVFYGEVIKIDTISSTYTFRIIELFKGKTRSQYINGKYFSNCSLFPQTKQLWIVYANYEDAGIIDISSCSPSRGFKPEGGSYPPPFPKTENVYRANKQIQSLDIPIFELESNNEYLVDWIYQLEKLRIYKKSQKEISDKEKTEAKLETYSQYIIISLIVNIVLFLSLIFVILKKKNFIK
ncbi:hypothetical protein [Flavobacterium sp. LC2016-01]|uniref:hypothetical protein n=1 Tax=Flavobacterium sp. LC2016-01 TaxID=2675876 RepID=UPI0012BAACD4|nr:hypothetical protein [Flavobacterium sp. LC2016-01]MTH18234.1 hypothetical protein [Flavobacterium sp. LC2016-01]